MVYNNVTELAPWPSQVLEINFDEPSISVPSNAWVRFSYLSRRVGLNEQYLLKPEDPTTPFGTDLDKHDFVFPPTSALRWDVNDQSDNFLSFYLRDSGDPYVHIVPTRIIPTLSASSLYELSGTIASVPFGVTLTTEQVEEDRLETLYLNTVGRTTSALSFSGGPLYLKENTEKTINLGGITTQQAGTFPHRLLSIYFNVGADIGGDEVEFKVKPTLLDPNQLESIAQGTTTNYCDVSAITGTVDYNTGDWTLDWNCGTSIQNSTYDIVYIKEETDLQASSVISGTTPTFTLSSDYPVYMYTTDFDVDGSHGFTLHFTPYAEIGGNYTATPNLTPKMRDLYQELSLDLDASNSMWRFIGDVEYDGLSASADGNDYIQGDWLGGDIAPITFSTDGDFFGIFTGYVEISSTNGITDDYYVQVYTNSAFADVSLSATVVESNNYEFELSSDIELVDSSPIYFDYYPVYTRMTLTDCDGNILERNTAYNFGDVGCLSALNLGLGTTIISLTAGDLGITSSYEADANLPLSAFTLKTVGEITTDCGPTSQYLISSYFEDDDGNRYFPPLNGNICWNIDSTLNYEITTSNRSDESIFLDTCVPSFDNDLLTINFSVGEESTIPRSSEIDIQVKYISIDAQEVEGDIFRLTPSPQNTPDTDIFASFFSVVSSGETLANSKTTTNYPLVTGSHDLVFSLNDLQFDYDVASVTWEIDNVVTSAVSSLSATINESGFTTVCASVSIEDVSLGGWGKDYCFTDQMCFILVGGASIDFIAFPRTRYGGITKTTQNYLNYTGSYGNTAYNCGHSETFLLSAEPGFETYNWKIGNNFIDSGSSNTTSLAVKGNAEDVGLTQTVWVSAYSISSDSVPFVGFSDNSSVFKQDVVFYDYFGYDLSLGISNDVIDLNINNNQPFTLNLGFNQLTASPVKIVDGGTATIELSTVKGTTSIDIPATSDNVNYFGHITLRDDDLFSIRPNTFNVMNLCVSADLNIKIKDSNDYKVKSSTVETTCIPVTAYNGPFLSISTESNCVSSGSFIDFKNVTPSFLGLTYSDFTFDDGNGNIMSTTTTSEALTGFYDAPGTYSPIMSGTLDGDLLIKTFKSFIIADCDSGCEQYNSAINRVFPDNLKFPNQLTDLALAPNERLTHHEFNQFVDRVEENFDYLKVKSKAYSLDVPTEVVNTTFLENVGEGLVDWKQRGNLLFGITSYGTIKIVDITNINDQTLDPDDRITVLKDDNIITEGEVLSRPVAMDVAEDASYYLIIDGGNKSVFVFTYDINSNKTELSTYWGGPGSRSARTKFNSPNDIMIGDDGAIYVLDGASFIVKKYNKYYNWVGNIEHPDFLKDRVELLSISVDGDDNLFVLGDNDTVYTFDTDGTIITTFKVDDIGSIYVNKAYDGIIYIVTGSKVYKYTKDGLKINQWVTPVFDSNVIGIEQNGTLLNVLTKDYFYVIFDCLKIENLRDQSLDSNLWAIDSIKMDKDEFIQDWNYNDSFDKLFQNVEMFKRSIINKFITYVDPFDKNKIIYDISTLSTEDVVECDITNFTLGINEFVSYDVINRQVENLYNCLDGLLEMITSKPKNSTQDCDDVCFTWKRLSTNNTLQPNTCINNPMSWSELNSYGVTSWYGLSCDTASATELEMLGWTLSGAVNRVPYSIDKCDLGDK